jgi:mannose-6-phosphate isomerase-like protein (cupin superfamily)
MKKQTHPHLFIRASVLLPLALTIWPPSQARSAGPSEGENLPEEKIMESHQPVTEQKPKTNEKGVMMKGFVQDIEALAIKNGEFRQVLYTAKNCQLVVMALKPKEDIGEEVHKLDQFFRVEEGSGEVVLDGVRTAIRAGFAVVVPAGTKHNIINTGKVPLKLYTIYSPPNHRDGVIHHTRADAEADHEHFDGKTTE